MTQVSATPAEALGAALHDRDYNHFRRKLGWLRHRRNLAAIHVYMEAEQEFELLRGDTPFGRTKVMTGREAREANKGFEDSFAKTCLSHPERRLWRWRPVDGKAVQAKCKQAAERFGV